MNIKSLISCILVVICSFKGVDSSMYPPEKPEIFLLKKQLGSFNKELESAILGSCMYYSGCEAYFLDDQSKKDFSSHLFYIAKNNLQIKTTSKENYEIFLGIVRKLLEELKTSRIGLRDLILDKLNEYFKTKCSKLHQDLVSLSERLRDLDTNIVMIMSFIKYCEDEVCYSIEIKKNKLLRSSTASSRLLDPISTGYSQKRPSIPLHSSSKARSSTPSFIKIRPESASTASKNLSLPPTPTNRQRPSTPGPLLRLRH